MAARGLVALAAVALAAGGYFAVRTLAIGSPSTLLSTGVLKPRDPVLIADFQSHAPDSLLGVAVTEAFRIDFAGSPVVTVMPTAKVRDALERMRRPAASPLDAALAREVAIREGVKALITGQVARLGGSFLLSAQLVSAASGEVLAARRETAADSTQVIAAIDRLSARLRERIGESLRSVRSEPPLTQLTTPSLPALHKYIEGQVAGDVDGDYVRAVSLLEEAVALDSGFATAWRTLGGFQDRLGNREQGVAALTKALQHEDRLTELEREHTRAIYYSAITGEHDRTVAIYRDITQRYPQDSLAANNLAVEYYVLHQYERAESIWRARLDTIHPWSPGIPLNLVQGLVALGRRAEAERLVDKTANLFPAFDGPLWFKARMATFRDDYDSARVLTQQIRDRYADNPVDKGRASRDLAAIAMVRGQPGEAEEHTRDAMMASVEAGRSGDYLKDAVTLGFIDTWFRQQPARGLRTVEAALGRFPLDSIKLLERPYVALAIGYASAGRPQRARALLGQYERGVDPMLRRIDDPMRRWAWGQVALAEGRYQDAIAEFKGYVPTPRNCLPCGQDALALAYDRAGSPDSAIAVYERYLTTPNVNRLDEQGPFGTDATQLTPTCKRLGELYEQRGDRAKARLYYSRFVKLWRDADPELKPAVIAVKERLRQLGGERSGTR
jgi:tetratricopeptide (TPR) repeat protein